MTKKSLVVAALLTASLAPSAGAQGWLDRAKKKAQEKIEGAADKAESVVKCAVDDRDCIDKAKAEGKKVETTGAPAQAGAASGGGTSGEPSADGSKAETLKPGEGAWSNFDFVPGSRVIFAEDFSKDRVGNFPRRLELANGNAEVVEWQGKRWLRINDQTEFEVPLPEVLPQRFTMEFDLTIPWSRAGLYIAPKADGNYGSHTRVEFHGGEVGVLRASSSSGSTLDPRELFPKMYTDGVELSRPFRVRLDADGKYMKVYLDEKRVANIPNADFGRANKIVFFFDDNTYTGQKQPPLLTNISINAGGKDMYDALVADGRVALQGIYFDTGSDRIRPESSGQLKQIADMLAEHPDLKLTIEGHTDNVGDAAGNQSLSERRAAAVKATLATQFKVDASRLTSKGFGATKPVAPNTTPEGRQQNRRVELVKG